MDFTKVALNFGEALAALKKGSKVARKGWNGKGMWLMLIRPQGDLSITGSGEDGFDRFELLPYIGMKTADNKFVPWLASQTDMLAEDWLIVWSD